MRAFHDLNPFAHRLRQCGWVSNDHAQGFTGIEQMLDDMMPDVSSWRGDDDDDEILRLDVALRYPTDPETIYV